MCHWNKKKRFILEYFIFIFAKLLVFYSILTCIIINRDCINITMLMYLNTNFLTLIWHIFLHQSKNNFFIEFMNWIGKQLFLANMRYIYYRYSKKNSKVMIQTIKYLNYLNRNLFPRTDLDLRKREVVVSYV